MNNLNSHQENQKIVSIDSDNFHLTYFSNMKITKWIYVPLLGSILYYFIFRSFCDVNLIDKKRARFNRGKILMSLFLPHPFLVIIFIVELFIFILFPVISDLNVLNKIMYVLTPLYLILLISPFLSFLVKVNSKKIFKISKIALDYKNIVVYRNAEIFDNKSYFEKLLKKPNQKLNSYILSQNFQNINARPLTENYKGTMLQKVDNLSQVQHSIVIRYWRYWYNFGFIIWYFLIYVWWHYFDCFFFSNIFFQKSKQDSKTNLSKKINWIILSNYLFTTIFIISFILFLVNPFTNFSYFPTELITSYELLLPVLHYIYCAIFLIGYVLLTLGRAQFTKRLVVKLCIKEYSKK